jgi:son of sevenless
MCHQQRGDARLPIPTQSGPPPPPIQPKTSRKGEIKLSDVDPLEMARQLTLMESHLYQKIRPIECLQRSRDQKGDTNDNISQVIQFANKISDWVAETILARDESRRRASVVKNFIAIADVGAHPHQRGTGVDILFSVVRGYTTSRRCLPSLLA